MIDNFSNFIGKLRIVAIIFSLFLIIWGVPQHACGFGAAFLWQDGTMTDLGPGIARAINNSGQIVGYSPNYNPFLWQDGKMMHLSGISNSGNGAYDINNSVQVVGDIFGSTRLNAFIWHNGTAIYPGTLGGALSTAFGINDFGWVVGTSTTESEEGHAYLWQNGNMTDLGIGGAEAINNSGQIVGRFPANFPYHAVLWQNGTMTDLGTLGGNYSIAYDINDSGWVVGNSTTASGDNHAFLWKDGVMIDIGTLPGGTRSAALAINNLGEIVGYSNIGSDLYPIHAFLWKNGVMNDLGTLPNGTNSGAYDINDLGQIVGWTDAPSTVPIPSAVVLLGAGLGRLGLYCRRKRLANSYPSCVLDSGITR